MQAFTGGGLKQDVIVGITDTTGSGANDPITYDVSTAQSAITTTQYTTDADGVVQ